MLNLYFKLSDIPKDLRYVKFNDAWFNRNIHGIKFGSKDIEKLLLSVDKVKYIGNNRVLSKFEPNTGISVRELSTGCKTSINVISFTDCIFDGTECGDNALYEIFKSTKGNLLVTRFCYPDMFTNDICLHYKGTSKIIHNNNELASILDKMFD